MDKICNNCKSRINEISKFCPVCGQPCSTNEEEINNMGYGRQQMSNNNERYSQVNAESPQRNKKNLKIIIPIIAVALIAIGIGAYLLISNIFAGPVGAVEKLADSISSGDYENILDCFNAESFCEENNYSVDYDELKKQMNIVLKKVSKTIEDNNINIDFEVLDYEKKSKSDNKAKYEVKFKVEVEEEKTEMAMSLTVKGEVGFIKEDGDWLIDLNTLEDFGESLVDAIEDIGGNMNISNYGLGNNYDLDDYDMDDYDLNDEDYDLDDEDYDLYDEENIEDEDI